ncbi:metallophosphoesterase [Sphingomonas sp. JC676]|uniref:metallophosphoesterase n=1 Tax=Sphingomonas sp. JC676 TaxID=2768065 RepID=UPI0016580236|nr:metallophosphoesterase [Sphingomonas sp. JC676]MBC9033256.1 metallophosphoesterase [Sphingomonas sp. JC676]
MLRALGVILVLVLALAGWCYLNILADPIVRRATIAVPGWPAGAAPLRVALISDVHVQGPDMPPERVARIVEQVNAQHPDIVLLAGDFVGDRVLGTRDYSDAEIAAPLARLSAPLGVYAVLGNHDYTYRGIPRMWEALERVGIRVLDNRVQHVGVLTLAGIGDVHSGHAAVPAVVLAAARMPGPILAFMHSPDVIPRLPSQFGVVLAGHTHCGQIVLPWYGQLASASRYGDRYRCGVIHESGRTIVVGAGWGTSIVPFRLGAPPDWWLVTVGPAQALAKVRAAR